MNEFFDLDMDKLSLLWQGANYQDNLLQAYRNFHLTMQSILIAVGAGLSVATLTFDNNHKLIASYGLLLIITILAIYLLIKMRSLIKARGEDVDYYHNQIIEFEKSLPKEERTLTTFKVYQKFHRNQTDINDYFLNFELTNAVINQLTEKGKGHTRLFLDKHLFVGFLLVWLSFQLIAILSLVRLS